MDTMMEKSEVELRKMADKAEKVRLAKMIVTYQSGTAYTEESLSGKTLKQLRSIYEKVMR